MLIWVRGVFMKTYMILFIFIVIMHLTTLVNVTLFEGMWDGIALFISNILFVLACLYFGIEYRANKNKSQ